MLVRHARRAISAAPLAPPIGAGTCRGRAAAEPTRLAPLARSVAAVTRPVVSAATVVVTGAAGHIGGNLVRGLVARGVRPRVLIRRSRAALDGLDVEEASGDVRDAAALERAFAGADVVYHLAGLISLDDRDAATMRAINVEGVRNVVAACLRQGVRRLVHFSSIHALSTEPHNWPVDETRPLVTDEPVPPYDRSKSDGEREVLTGLSRGLDAVIVNPTGVIGPTDYGPSHMGQLLLDLYHGRMPALVAGGFNWVDVRDVADGAIAAAQRGRTGERYLLAGARATLVEIAALVAGERGRRPPRFVSPMWLARAGAPFAVAWARLSGTRPLFNAASLHALRNHHDVRHDKAARELGFKPRPVRDSIVDAIASFRARGLV
jgi:dihydroflavonol-4-reductase